jgi:hypothetical protein
MGKFVAVILLKRIPATVHVTLIGKFVLKESEDKDRTCKWVPSALDESEISPMHAPDPFWYDDMEDHICKVAKETDLLWIVISGERAGKYVKPEKYLPDWNSWRVFPVDEDSSVVPTGTGKINLVVHRHNLAQVLPAKGLDNRAGHNRGYFESGFSHVLQEMLHPTSYSLPSEDSTPNAEADE